MVKHWLKIGYWNIDGLKRISDGTIKTDDVEVRQCIEKHDIFCLSEVKCSESAIPSIPGYSTFKLCRGINKKINRYFGGLVIYYRCELRPGLKFLPNKTSDYVWLKLCKNFMHIEKDLYMCCVYIPPENSSYYKALNINLLELIEEETSVYSHQGSVLLMGDMNARTNTSLDFIENDTELGTEEDMFYKVDTVKLKRYSQDKRPVSNRGKQLLDFCKAQRLRILNGRMLGDSGGWFTCHEYQGSSVVDYMITNEENLCSIPYFEVGDYHGFISDHCYISSALRCNLHFPKKVYKLVKENRMFPQKYVWKESSISEFQAALNDHIVQEKIKRFESREFEFSDAGINEMLENLNEVYISAADISLKRSKITFKNKKIRKDKKWFTKDLHSLRKSVSDLSMQLQKWPNDPQIRGNFFRTLKTYNKERKRKCRAFKREMLDRLDEFRDSNPNAYWKLLKQLKESEKNTNEVDIDLDEWKMYFKALNTQQIQNKVRKETIAKELLIHEQSHCFNEMNFRFSEKEIAVAIKDLKKGKAVGFDLISNEMIRYSQHVMIPLLLKTFNTILVSKLYPVQWCKGYVVPIHKSGSVENPSNYRGITIFSCVAKLFNTLITRRIENFIQKHKIIDERQIGFKAKFRTSDHMFILRSLIEKYNKSGSKLYACFIDFKKAFDTVDHTYLLIKMQYIIIMINIETTAHI